MLTSASETSLADSHSELECFSSPPGSPEELTMPRHLTGIAIDLGSPQGRGSDKITCTESANCFLYFFP